MLAFWGLVIFAAAMVVRQFGRSDRTDGTAPVHRTPQQVLAERFARGEIDEREFTSRLSALYDRVPGRS